MENPLISIIVPVYSVEEYLERCVRSLMAQTYENLEIILVDDGSPDNCGALCDGFAKEDSRLVVIHKENGGLSSARNAGVDIARGEYLGFVDSDDWMEPDAYEALVKLALQEQVKLVCGGRYDVRAKTGEKKPGLCPPKTEVISGEALVRRIFLWDNVDSAAWDKLYHRSLFETIRYPVGRIVEDVPTTYRIALLAGRVGMLSKPIYNYYHRPGSITNAAVSEKVFHFPGHTAMVYDHIRANYPSLKRPAQYLRVRSLGHTLLVLSNAGEQGRGLYEAQYTRLRADLRAHLLFLLTSPLPKNQERLTWLLLAADCYTPLRKVYHRIRRGR